MIIKLICSSPQLLLSHTHSNIIWQGSELANPTHASMHSWKITCNLTTIFVYFKIIARTDKINAALTSFQS